jgi:hypothetical protein
MPFFHVSLNVHLSITLVNDQLDVQIIIHLLQSSTYTCFEQYLAHPQEVKLYQYSIYYRHLLTVTIPDAVLTQFDLSLSKILLETCTCRGL